MNVTIGRDEVRVHESAAANWFGAAAAAAFAAVMASRLPHVAKADARLALSIGVVICAAIAVYAAIAARWPHTGLRATRDGLTFESGTLRRASVHVAWRDLREIRRGKMITPLWKPGTRKPRSVELVFRRSVDLGTVGYALMRPTERHVYAIAAELIRDEAAFVAALRELSGRTDLAIQSGDDG